MLTLNELSFEPLESALRGTGFFDPNNALYGTAVVSTDREKWEVSFILPKGVTPWVAGAICVGEKMILPCFRTDKLGPALPSQYDCWATVPLEDFDGVTSVVMHDFPAHTVKVGAHGGLWWSITEKQSSDVRAMVKVYYDNCQCELAAIVADTVVCFDNGFILLYERGSAPEAILSGYGGLVGPDGACHEGKYQSGRIDDMLRTILRKPDKEVRPISLVKKYFPTAFPPPE